MTDEELKIEWHNLLFGVRRSIRYHNYRRAFFDRLGNLTNFLTIITGGGVLFAVGNPDDTFWTKVFGLGATTSGALDLVLGFSEKGRNHFDLANQFIRVEQQMAKIGADPNEKQLKEMTSGRLETEAGEPPIFRALDIFCHNQLIDAMGLKKGEKRKLGVWKNLTKQWFIY